MHAVSANGTSVGHWPAQHEGLFWSPPLEGEGGHPCWRSLLHSDADEKPYAVHFRFHAPPAGTGSITFRTLIKRGPANGGEFHYPAKDLVLTEAEAATGTWRMAKNGASCDETCAIASLWCDLDTMKAAQGGSLKFDATVGKAFMCKLPYLSDCGRASPAARDDGMCWMHSASCKAGAPGLHGAPAAATDCSSAAAGLMRFCACKSSSRRALQQGAASATPGATSAASRAKSLGGWALLTAAAGAMTGGPHNRAGTLLAVLGALALRAPSAQAHNWMHTPGRARKEASTLRPCRGRKASDTHAQVGPGQSFTLKVATGHTTGHRKPRRATSGGFLFIVAGKNMHWLSNRSLMTMAARPLLSPDHPASFPLPAKSCLELPSEDSALTRCRFCFLSENSNNYCACKMFIHGGWMFCFKTTRAFASSPCRRPITSPRRRRAATWRSSPRRNGPGAKTVLGQSRFPVPQKL